jgi:hypothetical protein
LFLAALRRTQMQRVTCGYHAENTDLDSCMRNSLYDALEVNSSSSVNAIQAALRAVVRRFWAVPRDASGDSEEAVRFAALAASILVDPVRRKDYDAALNPGVGAGPWRLPIANRESANDGSTNSRQMPDDAGEVSQLSIEAATPKSLPGVDALAETLPDGKAWSSPLVYVALGAAFALLCFALSRPFHDWFSVSFVEAIAIAGAATVVLYALAAWLSRRQELAGSAAGLSRLAIIKWRREGSIFIGAPPPQHDTAWIFKLRLMELTRSAAGFVTSSSPWRRFAARLVDYSLVAVAVYFAVALVDAIVPILDAEFLLLRSVLVLPVLTVLAAIPASVFCHRWFGTTPGKWLFGLQLVSGITRPSDHAEPGNSKLLWSRAIRVAWTGAALGFWPIALFRLRRHLQQARDTEVDWEASGDSLVMARPMTALAVTTALVILLATSFMLVSGWRRDYIAFWPHFVTWTATARAAWDRSFPPDGNATPSVASSPATGPLSPEVTSPKNSGASDSTAAVPAQALPNARDVRVVPKAVAPPVPPASAKGPLSTPTVDDEMQKQANAAQARRVRIDGFARQAESARRSGSYAALQGNCQRWTQDQPGSSEAWRCLGLAQFENGAGRDALPALRQALKFEPNDAQVEAAILRILRP